MNRKVSLINNRISQAENKSKPAQEVINKHKTKQKFREYKIEPCAGDFENDPKKVSDIFNDFLKYWI